MSIIFYHPYSRVNFHLSSFSTSCFLLCVERSNFLLNKRAVVSSEFLIVADGKLRKLAILGRKPEAFGLLLFRL